MTAYDEIGHGYARVRRPDPRIAARIHAALGDARTVVNVGAGTGSYEPADRWVLAAEPSQVMIAQRAPGSAPAVVASAERLPLADDQVDAAMASLTLHHWDDWRQGITELKRVARRRVVIFSWAAERGAFWLMEEYLPDVLAWDATRFPPVAELLALLPGATVEPVPVPADCTDGFLGAFWSRPEAFLDPANRTGNSGFAQAPDQDALEAALERLRRDLADGSWHERHGHLLGEAELDAGYFLLSAELG